MRQIFSNDLSEVLLVTALLLIGKEGSVSRIAESALGILPITVIVQTAQEFCTYKHLLPTLIGTSHVPGLRSLRLNSQLEF